MLRGVYPDWRSRVEGLSMTCLGGIKNADFAQALSFLSTTLDFFKGKL
jgi:hypothetical protein